MRRRLRPQGQRPERAIRTTVPPAPPDRAAVRAGVSVGLIGVQKLKRAHAIQSIIQTPTGRPVGQDVQTPPIPSPAMPLLWWWAADIRLVPLVRSRARVVRRGGLRSRRLRRHRSPQHRARRDTRLGAGQLPDLQGQRDGSLPSRRGRASGLHVFRPHVAVELVAPQLIPQRFQIRVIERHLLEPLVEFDRLAHTPFSVVHLAERSPLAGTGKPPARLPPGGWRRLRGCRGRGRLDTPARRP